MINSGSEQPIGDPDSNSLIGCLQTHINLASVQVACNPPQVAIKVLRLRVHVIPSGTISNGASNPTRLVVPVSLPHTGLSLILRLGHFGASSLKGYTHIAERH